MSVELAQAYVTIIPSMEGSQEKITSGLTEACGGTTAESAGSLLGGGLVGGLGKAFAPAAVVGALAAGTKALYDVGETFDSAYDAIALGTGATGEALESLNQSFENLVGTVPGDVQTIADSMAELNTRTGATGEVLETLTAQFVDLDAIGYSADIDTVTASFNAWGIETQFMGDTLDDLFTISQSTGTSIDELANGVSASAGAWTAMGFSFSESAAMVGQFEKAGLNASTMVTKMAANIGELTLEGESNRQAYTRLTEDMKSYMEAGDYAAARDIAEKLFGTKNADAFLQALETGTVDINDLVAALGDNDGAIVESERSTRDFAETMELLKNNAALALEPLGSAIFGAIGDLLGMAVEPAQNLAQGIRGFFESIESGEGPFESFSGIGEHLGEVFDKLCDVGGQIGEVVMPVVSEIFGSVADSAGILLDGILTLMGDGLDVLASLLEGDFDGAIQGVLDMFDDWKTVIVDFVDSIFPGFKDIVETVSENVGGFFEGLGTAFSGFTEGIQTAFGVMKEVVQGISDFIGGIVDTVKGWLDYLAGASSSASGMSSNEKASYDPAGGMWATGGIARHAEGGVTRKLHIVGEAGPEAIVPLYSGAMDPFADAVASRIGGGGTNIYINGARVNDGEAINGAVGSFLLELNRMGAI